MPGRSRVRFGAFELIVDGDTQELWRDGRCVRLAPQAMRILIALTSAPGALVTREHLRSVLWPDGTHVDFDPSLNTAVRKLRAALGDEGEHPRYVLRVPGQGYRFIAPVHRLMSRDEAAIASSSRSGVASASRRLPLAGATACAAVAVGAAILVTIALSRQHSPRLPLTVRAVAAGADTRDGHRVALDATVASLRVIVGRLDPARLVVVDASTSAVPRRVCHEIAVAPHRTDDAPARRLTIRLLDACRGEQMWAATADVATTGEAEAGVMRAAARAVADQLLGGASAAREAAATTSGSALDAYRRGQLAARAGRRLEDLDAAVDAFAAARQLDADFAPAWAALARTRATRAARDGRDPGQLDLADAEAARALALDRELADAHVARGLVRFLRDRDLTGAEIWLLRARALGATAGEDLLWHACVLNAQQRFDDALRVLDEGIAREPRMAALHAWRGLVLHSLHRYDDELAALHHAAATDPHSAEALFHLGMGYVRRRQYDRALPALRRAITLSGDGGYYVSWYGRMAADAGDLRAAEQALQELERIARTRGLAPALSGAVTHHIDARRHRAGDL